jgi:glycosyltransferase 2 family protein
LSLSSFPLSRLLRIAVAVILTAIVLYQAHPFEVVRAAAGSDWRWILAALALVLVDRTLMAYRWVVLLCALTPESRPPFLAILRIFFVSTFVGTFLPSLGGDLYRAYSLARMRVSGAEAGASVLMDRTLGVLSIVIVGAVAVLLTHEVLANRWTLIALVIAAGGCAVAALAVFSERTAAAAQALASRLPHAGVRRMSAALIDAVRRYSHHHAELTNVLVMSVIVQIIRVLQAYALGRALGLAVPLPLYFAFIPAIVLIMQIPIAPSGIGTSQAAFLVLFATAGVGSADAVALSILFVALGIVGNLPGAILYASGRRPALQNTQINP